jgi:hypothetical protein
LDAQLLAITEAAEAGRPCPPLKIMAGAQVLMGNPGSSAGFAEAMERGLAEEYYNARKPSKKQMENVYSESMEHSRGIMNSLDFGKNGGDASAPTAVTLFDAQWWPTSKGDGLQLPAIRIPLDAVDAWWVAGGRKLSGGQSWLFGFFVPLDIGQ